MRNRFTLFFVALVALILSCAVDVSGLDNFNRGLSALGSSHSPTQSRVQARGNAVSSCFGCGSSSSSRGSHTAHSSPARASTTSHTDAVHGPSAARTPTPAPATRLAHRPARSSFPPIRLVPGGPGSSPPGSPSTSHAHTSVPAPVPRPAALASPSERIGYASSTSSGSPPRHGYFASLREASTWGGASSSRHARLPSSSSSTAAPSAYSVSSGHPSPEHSTASAHPSPAHSSSSGPHSPTQAGHGSSPVYGQAAAAARSIRRSNHGDSGRDLGGGHGPPIESRRGTTTGLSNHAFLEKRGGEFTKCLTCGNDKSTSTSPSIGLPSHPGSPRVSSVSGSSLTHSSGSSEYESSSASSKGRPNAFTKCFNCGQQTTTPSSSSGRPSRPASSRTPSFRLSSSSSSSTPSDHRSSSSSSLGRPVLVFTTFHGPRFIPPRPLELKSLSSSGSSPQHSAHHSAASSPGSPKGKELALVLHQPGSPHSKGSSSDWKGKGKAPATKRSGSPSRLLSVEARAVPEKRGGAFTKCLTCGTKKTASHGGGSPSHTAATTTVQTVHAPTHGPSSSGAESPRRPSRWAPGGPRGPHGSTLPSVLIPGRRPMLRIQTGGLPSPASLIKAPPNTPHDLSHVGTPSSKGRTPGSPTRTPSSPSGASPNRKGKAHAPSKRSHSTDYMRYVGLFRKRGGKFTKCITCGKKQTTGHGGHSASGPATSHTAGSSSPISSGHSPAFSGPESAHRSHRGAPHGPGGPYPDSFFPTRLSTERRPAQTTVPLQSSPPRPMKLTQMYSSSSSPSPQHSPQRSGVFGKAPPQSSSPTGHSPLRNEKGKAPMTSKRSHADAQTIEARGSGFSKCITCGNKQTASPGGGSPSHVTTTTQTVYAPTYSGSSPSGSPGRPYRWAPGGIGGPHGSTFIPTALSPSRRPRVRIVTTTRTKPTSSTSLASSSAVTAPKHSPQRSTSSTPDAGKGKAPGSPGRSSQSSSPGSPGKGGGKGKGLA